ncbi:MAG: hypothetical protein K9L64_06575 [Candidatus Izimaplasma sp.]|nr:hypothetical protein [Candidatus Izimaplasma bacterium]
MKFQDYITDNNLNLSRFTSSFKVYLETMYNKYHLSLALFISSGTYTEEQIKYRLNEQLRKTYKIKYHNIGKNPNKRYYAHEDHYPWLKLEHFLIAHFYSIGKSVTNVSNKYIAISLGWLSPNEMDPEVITKALRKVTDNLAILKNDRKTISVEQKYVYGKKGSYHTITANWDLIIDLYTKYDDKSKGSIRFRKSIKYRIISFLKTNTNKFSNALAKLMQKQRNRYLKDIVKFNLKRFQDLKYLLFRILSSDKYKMLAISESDLNTNNIIPEYNHPELILTIKSERIYKELSWNNYLQDQFRANHQINLSIVAAF